MIRGDARQPRRRKQPEHAAARHHAGTLPAAEGRVNPNSCVLTMLRWPAPTDWSTQNDGSGLKNCSRHPLGAEGHDQKLVFPSNYTHGFGPPDCQRSKSPGATHDGKTSDWLPVQR